MKLLTILATVVAVTLIIPFCANVPQANQQRAEKRDTLREKALALRARVELETDILEGRVGKASFKGAAPIPVSASEQVHYGPRPPE